MQSIYVQGTKMQSLADSRYGSGYYKSSLTSRCSDETMCLLLFTVSCTITTSSSALFTGICHTVTWRRY